MRYPQPQRRDVDADPEKPGGMISEDALKEKKKALEGGLAVDIRGSTRALSVKSLSTRVSPVRAKPSPCL